MTNDFNFESLIDTGGDERHAMELVQAINTLNKQISPLEATKKELVNELRQWMGLSKVVVLYEPERSLTAQLQDRKGVPTYDLVSLVGAGKGDALISAASAGMARIDHQMLTRFRNDSGSQWADLIAKYEMPGKGTTALIVSEAK